MLEFNEGQLKEMSNCTIATAYSYKPNTLQAAKKFNTRFTKNPGLKHLQVNTRPAPSPTKMLMSL